MIPKVVHRIWLGPESLSARFSDATACWQEFFPEYELRLWRDEDMAELALPAQWASAKTYAERADIARYRIIFAHGGIYADCDVVPLTRFDFLWSDRDTDVVFEEAPGRIWNGLFVSEPGSTVLRLASGLCARSARRQSPDAAPNVRTGPYVFSAAIAYARDISPHGIRVYPPGFVHVRGTPQAHAVASAPFREPPAWAEVPGAVAPVRRAGLEVDVAWAEAMLMARLFPVRARRRVRRWREQLGLASL